MEVHRSPDSRPWLPSALHDWKSSGAKKQPCQKSDEKDKAKAEETEPAISLKEEEQVASGGYGAASKGYGGIPQSSYADYEKLFSYLGKFRSQSAYEDLGINDLGSMNKMLGGSNFSLIDKETMETGAKFVKYFKSPVCTAGLCDGGA